MIKLVGLFLLVLSCGFTPSRLEFLHFAVIVDIRNQYTLDTFDLLKVALSRVLTANVVQQTDCEFLTFANVRHIDVCKFWEVLVMGH
jgi:hypothetical protein